MTLLHGLYRCLAQNREFLIPSSIHGNIAVIYFAYLSDTINWYIIVLNNNVYSRSIKN